ncbi:Pyridoxal 5'-phosphate synthase-like subunit PDX1.2 [Bienertia sinuspersici]
MMMKFSHMVRKLGHLMNGWHKLSKWGGFPLAHFACSGIVTPTNVALMMQLGCDRVSIGHEVYEGLDPVKHVWATVEASILNDV